MSNRIVFVDSRVAELAELIEAQYGENVSGVITLDDSRPGLEQMAEHLSGQGEGLAGAVVDVFSHGRPGAMWLGSGEVDEPALWGLSAELRQAVQQAGVNEWRLNGCRVGAGAQGQSFLSTWSQVLSDNAATIHAARSDLGAVSEDEPAVWDLPVTWNGAAMQQSSASWIRPTGFEGTLAVFNITATAVPTNYTGTAVDDVFNVSTGYFGVLTGGAGIDVANVTFDVNLASNGATLYYKDGSGLVGVSSTSPYSSINGFLATAYGDTGTGLIMSTGGAELILYGFESINANLIGGTQNDLLIFMGGTNYAGGAGTDAFYADWSTNTVAVNWVNDPTLTQAVSGTSISTISGIERLLVSTGSGDDVIDNSYVGNGTDDYIDGGAGNDVINSGNGNDTIYGGAGSDVINSGNGNSTIYGGIGNDTITIGAGTSTVDAGDGNDVVNVSAGGLGILTGGPGIDVTNVTFDVSLVSNGGFLYYKDGSGSPGGYSNSTYSSINGFLAKAYGDTGTGLIMSTGGADLTLYGFESISANLIGGALNDILIFMGGTNYAGGAGTDTFYADWSTNTVAVNWMNNPAFNQTVNGVSVSGLERLLVSTGSGDDLIDNSYPGNGTDDYIDTGAGNDVINGGAGNDTLIGGAGNDTITVGIGQSMVDAGDGNDTVNVAAGGFDTISGGLGTDTINAAYDATNAGSGISYWFGTTTNIGSGFHYTSGIGTSSLTYSGVHATLATAYGDSGTGFNIFTSTYEPSVTANGFEAFNINVLGSAFNDLIIYQGGTNYAGGAGIDTFYADWSTNTVAVNWVNDPALIQTVNGASISGMERLLISTGSGNDVIDNSYVGNGTNDYIDGGAGNDVINGGAGNDTLIGGTGNDTITVGIGTFAPGIGTSTVDAGDGDDIVNVIAGGGGNISGGLGTDTINAAYDATNAGSGISYWFGTTTNIGSGFHYTSGIGTSSLTYSGVHATLATAYGDSGTGFNIFTSAYEPSVTANGFEAFNINVLGSAFNDLIIYQGGTNYAGGAGTDTFYADWSANTVAVNWMNNPAFNQTVNGVSVSGLERLLVSTGSGDDLIDNSYPGNGTDDYIDTGAGNDVINGGAGNDTLIGGAGNDTYVFKAGDGIDTITDVSGTADQIQFGPTTAPADLQLQRSGNDLQIRLASSPSDLITLTGWATGDAIEQFSFADGTIWDATQIAIHGGEPAGTMIQAGTLPQLTAGVEDQPYTLQAADLLSTWYAAGAAANGTAGLTLSGLSADHGTVVDNGNGSYTVTPALNYNGPITFSYFVNSSFGTSAPASLSTTLAAVNDAPALTGLSPALPGAKVDTGATVTTAQLLGGWTDVEGSALSVLNLAADHGVVIDNGNGSYTISPQAGYIGPMTLSYAVSDGSLSTAASMGYTVSALNTPQLTGSAVVLPAGTEDQSYTVSAAQLLAGWSEVGNPVLSLSGVTADHGTVTAHADGSYTIAPAANYNGPMVLSYGVTDGISTSPATLGLTLTPVNDPPALTGTAFTLPAGTEDVVLTVAKADLLAGWTDVDGQTLTLSGLTTNHGTVVDNGNGTVTLTPAANYNGPISLSYLVSDGIAAVPATLNTTLAAVNDAPALTGTAFALPAGTEDVAITVTKTALLAGWTDVEGQSLSLGSLSSNHGTVVDNGDGTVTLTPTANYNGPISLDYSVSDGLTAVPVSLSTSLAAVNDAPALTGTAFALAAGTEDVAITLATTDLLTGWSDVEGSALSLLNLSADHGTVTTTAKGLITVTPQADYNGPITLSYAVSDGTTATPATLSTTLAAVNDAPVAHAVTTAWPDAINNQPLNIPMPAGQFTDVDSASLSYSATLADGSALPTWLSINPASGALSGTPTGVTLDTQLSVMFSASDGSLSTAAAAQTLNVLAGAPVMTMAPTDLNATGSSLANVITGNSLGNTIQAGAGNDVVFGGNGNDVITGGVGADLLEGGLGADQFVFSTLSDSPTTGMDRVLDFQLGIDQLNLQAIDANTLVAGDQAFSYIGSAGFSFTPGELRFADWTLSGDVNGDGVADFAVKLVGVDTFNPGNVIF